MQGRLRRYSAIRAACRHLHTMCTPILFAPAVRARVVERTRLENHMLRLVAEQFHTEQLNWCSDNPTAGDADDSAHTGASSASSERNPICEVLKHGLYSEKLRDLARFSQTQKKILRAQRYVFVQSRRSRFRGMASMKFASTTTNSTKLCISQSGTLFALRTFNPVSESWLGIKTS